MDTTGGLLTCTDIIILTHKSEFWVKTYGKMLIEFKKLIISSSIDSVTPIKCRQSNNAGITVKIQVVYFYNEQSFSFKLQYTESFQKSIFREKLSLCLKAIKNRFYEVFIMKRINVMFRKMNQLLVVPLTIPGGSLPWVFIL